MFFVSSILKRVHRAPPSKQLPPILFRYSSTKKVSTLTQGYIDAEAKYGAHNYHPIPAVINRASGIHLWDVDGNQYMDFLSAYSAVNQGHCHPAIIKTLIEQSQVLTLTSRAFHTSLLSEYSKFVTEYFNYKRVLPMNTGVEACESAVKIARNWGYTVKGIEQDQALLVCAEMNFHGRSIFAVSASTDPLSYSNFGPLLPGIETVEYNNIDQLKSLFEQKHERICAFMCEPVQGEAGVIIPSSDYLTNVRALCDKYNILWICDEVQTGLGRCGTRLCADQYFNISGGTNNGPDLVTLGKALSGGTFPVSCVLAKDDRVMDVLTPGTHGSTYGGNPLACKVAMTALTVLKEEGMFENAAEMGKLLMAGLKEFESFDIVTTTRGQGLMCAMEIVAGQGTNVNAWEFCLGLKQRGLLAKPTQGHNVRLTPPLIITKSQVEQSLEIIYDTLKSFS